VERELIMKRAFTLLELLVVIAVIRAAVIHQQIAAP
jgi:Tfp pilus assembly protein FimT